MASKLMYQRQRTQLIELKIKSKSLEQQNEKLKRSNASLRGHLKKTKDELKSLKFLM